MPGGISITSDMQETPPLKKSEEELKSLLMKGKRRVKKLAENSSSGPITSWQIDGKTMETVTDFIFLGSKITADGETAVMKLKDTCSLEEKL